MRGQSFLANFDVEIDSSARRDKVDSPKMKTNRNHSGAHVPAALVAEARKELEQIQAVNRVEAPETLAAMEKLATAYLQDKQYAEARDTLLRLLKTRSSYTENIIDRQFMRADTQLGAAFFYLGDYSNAWKIQEELVGINISVFGIESVNTVRSVRNLLFTAEASADHDVVEVDKTVIAAHIASSPKPQAEELDDLFAIGLIYGRNGYKADANKVYRQILRMGPKLLLHPGVLFRTCFWLLLG